MIVKLSKSCERDIGDIPKIPKTTQNHGPLYSRRKDVNSFSFNLKGEGDISQKNEVFSLKFLLTIDKLFLIKISVLIFS